MTDEEKAWGKVLFQVLDDDAKERGGPNPSLDVRLIALTEFCIALAIELTALRRKVGP